MMKNYTQKTTKRNYGKLGRMMMLAVLMLCGGMAWAQTPQTLNISTSGTYTLTSTGNNNQFSCNESNYDYLGNVTAEAGVGITIVFDNTETILSTGQFNVSGDNASITLQLGSNCSACTPTKPTLKTNEARGTAWFLMANYNTNAANKTIKVLGKNPETITTDSPENFTETSSHWDENFVLDGGAATMTVIDNDTTNLKVRLATGGIIHHFERDGGGQPFRVQQGTLTLTKVTLQNYATGGSSGNNQVSSAGIQIMTANTMDVGVKVALTQCHFTKLAASSGYCAVRMQGTKGALVTSNYVNIDHCLFDHCYCLRGDATTNDAGTDISEAGVVRTLSNFRSPVSVTNCKLENNLGPSIRHHEPYNMTIQNNIVQDNWNKGRGGGMQLRGPATLIGCKVLRNTATGDGGGIFYGTFVDGTDMNPGHSILTMDENSEVSGNKSYGNGGGIMLCGEQIHPGSNSNNQKVAYYANGTNGQLIEPYEPIRVEFVLNGGTISDNRSSGQGGGVCITRDRNCTFYGTNCYLKYGTITGNKTWGNNGLTGEGGGVALITSSDYDNASINPSSTHPANTPNDPYDIKPQDINVVISEAGATKEMKIQNNSGSDGGGIYVDAHPVTYHDVTSKVTTIVYDYATVGGTTDSLGNKATNNGGGLYVKKGTVSIRKQGDSHSPTLQKNTASSGSGGGIFLNEGNVDMISAIIGGGDYSNPNNIISYGNTAGVSGGGLYVNTGSITMLSTSVSSNTATNGNGGGIFVNTGDVLINRNEQGGITPSQITYNQAHNGGGIYNHAGSILAFGTVGTGEAGHVQISNNQATAGSGGGIYCTGDATTSSYDIRLRRVDIKNNTATANGGGIYLDQGLISVVNGIIDSNSASGNGGGVYTHNGNIDINPTGDERNATQITNNTATINGGGLNTHHGFITVQGNDRSQRVIIKNNVATTGSGGAIFCMGENANAEYITVRHTDLVSNKAELGTANYGTGSEVAAGCGGGIYLQQGKITITDVNIQNNYAKVNGGGINNHSGSIDVNGCYIGSSHSTSGNHYYKADAADGDTDRGNKADNSGGGIYTRLGDIDIEDYVETSGNIFREESKVTFNEAAKNGGGIDTHEGIIYINKEEEDDQIEVAFNKAERGGGLYANAGTIKAYNALIHDNTATLHGGGANNHSGDIIIYGGILSNNTAKEGHGGGAYTNVGDIDLFQFPSTELQNPTLNHGTKVYNNIAKLNGGAFNNHTGRVDVRHATIYNNTSTLGNGGAIYCEGPHANVDRGLGFTIRLLCSDMVQNKTRGQDGTATDPTGRGGGIYLKYGSIYAHYSNIRDNEANIAGGGLNNHEGNILLYGCDITGNRALELDGGGIFIKSGSITTGPSTVREAAPTSAKATIVQNNTAYRNGGGIINLDGDITLNGDLIGGATSNLGNKALTGNGGGVYIANGIINMKGGQIDNNTAENGKGGGVYSGGGEFNIGEREENPSPIVLIVDSEVKRVEGGQTATVHYHLVDQGKYDNVSNVAHGIIWGTSNQPTTEVVYNTTTGGYNYVQGEPACERIIIPSSMINAGTTYYAKAFYRYTTGGNVITGYSETIEFVTFSNSEPLVISGSVSNITKNSAQGSGRVMDNGGSNITERGVQIWTGDTPPANDQGLVQSSETTEFFTVDLTGLTPNTPYHARAYAKNENNQIAFGNTVDFTTLKNTPDMGNGVVSVTTSIENGVIVARASFTMSAGTTFGTGANDVKAYGFVWSRDDDPELVSDHTVAGTLTTGTTTFTATYTGVTPGITFYVRAYASTIESEVNSSSDITKYSITAATQHVAPMLDGSPVVRAIEISGITQTSATITCQIYSGYEAGTKYGVYVDNLTNTTTSIPQTGTHYFPSTNATPANEAPNTDPYPYTYTVQLTGLTPGTTYYLKAYGTNATSPSYASEDPNVFNYGNGYNFTALPVMQPNVVVEAINYYYDAEHPENTDHTKVDVVCRIVNDGGEAISQNNYGINYGYFQTNSQTGDLEPVAATNSPIRPNVELSSDEFTITLTGLTAHKDYWVSAFATNSAGTHTCQTVTFTTNYDHPSVAFTTTNPISGVDFSITDNGNNNYSYQYTAVGNYTVTPHDTDEPVNTHGVCWSIFRNPTRRISAVSDSNYEETTNANITTAGNYFQTFHPAYPNTKYYVHAYVSTSTPDANNKLTDIVYDPADPNITFVSLPIVHTGNASAITNSSASLTVNINSPDREYHLRKYGVCWVVRTNGDEIPTRTAGYYVEGDITAANPTAVSYTLTANVGGTAGTTKTYRYRAYCINENSDSQGNIAYGDIKEFTTTAYTITGTTNPTEAGWVSYGGNLTTGGGWDGSSSITVEAHTNDGWHFENWTLDNGTSSHSSDNPLTETPTAGNHTYQANFKAIVSATVNPENTGTVSGAGNYAVGTTCNLTATAESGYTFLYWTDDAGNIIMDATGDTPEDNTYAFTVVGPVTVTANFTSRNRSTNNNSTINAPRSRDIYPAPAREPWDWDEETIPTDTTKAPAMTDTLPERHICTTEAPRNIPMIDHNTAEFGGGVYVDYTKGEGNTEPTKLYFSGGNSNEKRGKIIFNYASRAGGGIYLADSAYMQMKGYCEVNGNRVPADSLGGGIYLSGRLYVGNPGDDEDDNSLMVNQNFAIDDASFITNYVGHEDDYTTEHKFDRNNIYLPKDTYSYATGNNASTNDNSNVITLLADISAKNGDTYYSNMGFSVPNGYCPVITTAATFGGDYMKQGDENFSTIYEPWMSNLMPAYDHEHHTYWNSSALFDDSESHIAIHTETDIDPFRAKYIFLWGSWTNPKVDEDPEIATGGINLMGSDASHKHYNITYTPNPVAGKDDIAHWEILSPEGLSWFSSYINGLNAFATGDGGAHKVYDAQVNPYATAKLMNDIDMSAAFWVPLGSVTSYDGSVYHDDENNEHTFKGTFDGQGYIITGLDCRFLTGVNKYGLFGKLDGEAVVKNVFIDDSKYTTIDENAPYYVGGVAGILSDSATISASEARVVMDVNKANKAMSYVGGLVGKTEGTTTNPSIIHSSMAMPEIIGTVDYMGGLVGQLGANNKLLNSFSNPKFPESNNNYHPMSTGKFIGGLVGENNGIVENCYSRLQGNEPTSDGTKSVFGWLAGTNTVAATSGEAMGGIRFCYIPEGKNVYVKALQPDGIINQDFGSGTNVGNKAPYGQGTYSETKRYSQKYGFKHRDHQMTVAEGTTNPYIIAKTNDTLIGGLMHALNHWVDTANKTKTVYHKWTRTMASPINDDYPIPVLTDFNSVGSKDGIYLLYEDNINHMWTGGKKFDTVTALHNPNAAMYLYDVQPGDTPDTVKITGNTAVRLYINEEIGITQPANAVLTARAGVTIKNHRKVNDFTTDPNWHLFSSAIQDVPMGLDYHTDTTYSDYTYIPPYSGNKYSENIPNKPKHSQSIWGNRNYFDPPQTTWWQSDNGGAISYNADGSKIGYFPTNTPYGTWRPGFEGGHTSSAADGFFDLYCYSEEFFHWINFKREGSTNYLDHWHMDGDHNQDHWRLDYGHDIPSQDGSSSSFVLGNEPNLLTGKGYMMALSSESMMMADGQLNTGNVYAPVTLTPVGTHCVTPYNYDEPWRTLNLVGNPYQSYLDFLELIADDHNKALLYSDHGEYSYATRDDNNYEFVFYTEEQSANSSELTTSRYIHPHQGFFIKVKDSGNLKFTDDMRVAGTNTSLGSDFRDIDYPLVNLICYEPSGHRNFTTVEVNRPSLGGGSKMQNLRTGYTSIYAHFEDNDYQTLFTPVGVSTVPVWFETEEDGVYTLRWNTLHGYFNYLHLIDHIMGTDIDCLATDEYKFEAKTSDYKSRFRLVFDCVGVEEYEEDDLNSATFAFQMGDELVINGEGMLQMFDVSGRCLMSTRTMGQQSSVSLPKTAAGVYLLRLTTDSQVKVQKMVIK